MGLSISPRFFTKILKPVYATLHRKGNISMADNDDSCLQGHTKHKFAHNVSDTVHLVDDFGIYIT